MEHGAQPMDDERFADAGLGGLAHDPGMGLRLAQIIVFRDLTATFRPLGLSPAEFAALTIIRDNPGLRLGALADMMLIRQPNLMSFIGGLQKRHLIARTRDPIDKRSFHLSLTPAGSELLVQADAAHDGHRQRLAEHLGVEDRDTLARLLNRLTGFKPIDTE